MELLSPAHPPAGFSSPASFREAVGQRSGAVSFPLPEIVEESGSGGVVHVAVGKSVGKAAALLNWTCRQLGNWEICILHVHQPSSMIPTLLGKLPASQANSEVVTAYRREEQEQMQKLLFNYMRICSRSKVKASVLVTEASQVQKGIIDLVNKHGIRKLVMGAVPENCMKMKTGSSKANYAAKNAPLFCEIQFVNKGKLVWRREAFEGTSFGDGEVIFDPECRPHSSGRRTEDQAEAVPTEVVSTTALPSSMNRFSPPYFRSFSSPTSTGSSSGYNSSIEQGVSPDSGSKVDEESLHAQLTEMQREAEASRDEAFQQFSKRKKLEAEAVEAISKVNTLESAHAREIKLRMEAEDALEITIQEREKLFDEREEVTKELQKTMRNIALLDSRAQEANRRREEASGELKTLQFSISALRLEKQKIRRQKMEATHWLDRWKSRGQAGGATYNGLIGCTEGSPEVVEFSLADLQTATCNFSESFKIGQSGHGCVYKGEMLDRTIAIKKLHPHKLQRQSDFEQEVQVLGKLQHHHLVTLIGVCPEAWSLVYEYLPNGSLQDCLFKRNNICSLNWKTRAKIIAEISSALLLLHSCEPENIVHGNLKPENVLLGSDLSCKLCDFAICRLMPEETLRCPSFRRDTELKGALSYTDPESRRTGSLSTKSDIYSFGLIILQLLTGRDPVGLAAEVRKAISFGKLATVLDSSAGEWPNFVSKKLVYLGLQCCELNSRDRPDLTPSLVRELEQLHTSEERPVPSFFLCPILQEIMHDPQVAADGFSYERDTLLGWLENGRETSPMTNLKLDHLHLTPNHALRQAIQDWLCNSEGRSEEVSVKVASSMLQARPNAETGQSSSLRSTSIAEGANDQPRLTNSGRNYRRVQSDIHGMRVSTFSPERSSAVTPCSSSIEEVISVDWDESRNSYSSHSSGDMADDSASTVVLTKDDHRHFSSPSSVSEERVNEELYDQLEQSMAEAEKSRREAFERRQKAEKDAIDAIHRAKASERLYAEEVRQRKEVEEALERVKEELRKMKQQVAEVAEELYIAVEHKSSLEGQIANSNLMVKDLEQKLFSAEKLLQKYKKERDELQAERDNALKEAEELRKEQAEASANTLAPEFFSEFSFSELEEATSSFDLSLKIGEGRYGNIYTGLRRHTEVAIKMLRSNSMQGPSEFQQEVTVLSKLRHPNIVTLIGACPEFLTLVYEHLPNGSLEDRLCSALIFLHSCNPNRIVHGDLKPANILLDSNFVSKLSDFGICHILNQNEFSCITDHPRGALAYMDPEFCATGEMTTKSDVYSFGIILLRLLTGTPAAGIAKEVKYALDKGNLKNLLDPTAGDWPFVQAQQLAHIAMRCCEMNGRSRPDLASDVWRVLERMRVSCGPPPFLMNAEEDCHIPPYFMCPIFQAKVSENLHGEELRQTKEVEEMVKDLEQKVFSAVQLLQKYNHMERDELQIECDNVLKEEKELRKEQAEVVVYTPAPVFFSEFSYSEIVQATSSFNQSLMIGQGGCGDIYKGLLRHIQLAIKMLHSNSMQGPLEFQQEAVMEELIKMAKISYKSCSLAEKNTAQQFFKELNRDYDGKVSFHEFLGFIRDKGLAKMGSHHFFQTLDRDGSEILDFVQAMALYCMIQSGRPFCYLYCMIQSGRPFCYGCNEFIPGMYFTCSSCHQSGKNVCCLCPECFENGAYCHEHDQFFDNYDMLEVKRMKGLDTHWKQQHQNWAKKKGNSLRDEIPFEVSSISMDEKLDSRRQFMHMSQFDRSSPRPLALPDGGGIVGSIASSVSEVATTNNRAHLVGQDQCDSTVSHCEIRNNRETSDKQGLTMSLSCVEDHLQAFGCKHKDDVKSLCGNLLSAIYLFFLPIESFWVYWRPCQFENNERQAFDATNNRANIIKADECGPTASNSDKGSTRKALKRARLSNILSVEDLQQHFGARCKDAAKGLGDSIARKSVKVGDIPLGAQSNSIIFLVRRRTLTHKHCVRLKKSQDLQRSLRMDCSGGLSSQSAIGLPDGRHILSLSEKKIVRKTLKRKCRTMCVHILEDHRQHVHRRWENAAKASTTKHNSRQLVMHGVSIAKRICRQHGINQWPFQKHYATRKQYSLGDERSVEVTSLATDGKLVSRLQLIHISWLGRFSPWRSTLPAIALLSSEFAATINGANFVEQDQSGSTASHSGKKIIRRTENGEWINSSISLENLQQLFGSKRKNAAESLSVSESTLKRICRQHGIERWPSQRGSRERQAFDATNNRANIIKADERGPTASNSDKESTRKAFKRARLSNVLSVEDLQQHFGARCKDAAKGLGVRRRALTHKHCVRLKKSQDLQRSLRMDCSGGLSSQSAIGLPDGRHVPSLLEKKIERKTLKRKCRTMCVHILEDHRHLDRRWENAAKASTTKHNCWQLVMHGVSTAKRIRRQHGINQWPFQRHFATRKRYSLGDERSVEATSLATDGKLVSRLQLIHISWLGRFSPRRSTLPAIALLSSEFAAKINGANFVERDQSGSTASHSGKKIIRRTANGEWINSSISLENLQQLFGSKRKDAAERLGVSESTFKRICRQHGIERWPSQRGSQVLKPPDPAERNESTTCKALSTHGQIEIENEMVGQLHEPNEFPPDFFDGLPCWNTENGILFPQPQVASTQMSSGNMGSSGDCRNLLVSQAEPSLEGHGSEAIYWTMPPCSDLASSQQTPTIPYTMLSIPHTTPPLTIQQDMRSLTIKAIYGDTIIKFKLPLSSGIIGLKEEVSKRLKFELDSFEVKYKDECGDLILIACDEDLRDCLELFNSSGNQEIRLLVSDRFANTTNFCKNCRSLKRKRA